MAVFVQHGSGRTNKIETALTRGHVSGVILSPKDSAPDTLGAFTRALRTDYPGAELLLDPQVHAFLMSNAKIGRLGSYPYRQERLRMRDLKGSALRNLVRKTLSYQTSLPLSALLSPTVLVSSFDSRSAQKAIDIAEASVERHRSMGDAPPLLVSLLISESALELGDPLDEFLDEVSGWEGLTGFYVVVQRAGVAAKQYTQRFESRHLAALMYLTYVLGALNSFRIVLGYTDLVGMLLHAAGAAACAAGWAQSLRRLTPERFIPPRRTGRPRKRKRYTSLPLLNSVLLTDLDACEAAGCLPAALSRGPYDEIILAGRTPADSEWTPDYEALHHWWVLSRVHALVVGHELPDRLRACSRAIGEAGAVWQCLEEQGLGRFRGVAYRGHLEDWQGAINLLAQHVKDQR